MPKAVVVAVIAININIHVSSLTHIGVSSLTHIEFTVKATAEYVYEVNIHHAGQGTTKISLANVASTRY